MTEKMPHTFFRLIHRARSRSQRRKFYGWALCCFTVVFFLIFTNQSAILAFTSSQSAPPMQIAGQQDGSDPLLLLNDPANTLKGGQVPGVGADMRVNVRRALDNSLNMQIEKNVDNNNNRDNNNDDDSDEESDLLPDLAPATVHYIWCGGKGRTFEFRHYLSIKRVNNLIKPDKIIFHYQKLPESDPELYYTWFDLIRSETDTMVLRPLNTSTCDTSGPHRYMLALSLLEQFGGIFVPEDAILVDFPVHLRAHPFISGVVPHTLTDYRDGVIVAKKNGFVSPASQSGLNIVLASGRSAIQGTIDPCGTVEHFSEENDGHCLCVKVTEELFPKDIWGSDTRFGTLARLAAYGDKDIRMRSSSSTKSSSGSGSSSSKRGSIPKFGHYICWDCDIKFNTYLSIMSSLHVAGLSKVYIHGLKPPTGFWWGKLVATQRVSHVLREYPEHSYDNAAMTQELAHGIMRVAILLKYGGVYIDSKVIWTNRIPDEYYSYDAVAAPDWHQYGGWPDSVSHSTIMARSHSEYLLKLRNLHYQHHKKRFWFVDQFLAYKILEQNPGLLHLDRRFQVKCLNKNCHPTWVEGYKAENNENPQGASFNWQNDTLSVYWDVFPDLELDTVKYTSGPIVDVARRALKEAGVSVQELTAR